MKKVVALLFAILFFGIITQAQDIKWGIKAGSNFTEISGRSFNQNFNLAYQAGLFSEIDFTNTIGIQPEILFSEISSTTTSGLNAVYSNFNLNHPFNLNYLSIPILLRYNLNKLVTLNVGPQFSILMSNNNSVMETGENAFKQGDVSMVGGIQLNLAAFRIYGRYAIGISDLNNISSQDTWNSQQIQLGIGLRL